MSRTDVESLYLLYSQRHNYGVLSFEAYVNDDESEDKKNTSLFKNMDIVIEEKLEELRSKGKDIYERYTVDYIARLLEVIGHLSVSRCLKILEVSGVELI
jgi:hypothetical protein